MTQEGYDLSTFLFAPGMQEKPGMSAVSYNYTQSPCAPWSSRTTFPSTLETDAGDDNVSIYTDATASRLYRACKKVLS